MNGKLDWYGYKHVNGTRHLRRYFGDYEDIQEAKASPFVQEVTEIFECNNRKQAEEIMRARLP